MLTSAPDGYARTGWRLIAGVAVALFALPPIMGLLARLVLLQFGPAHPGAGALRLLDVSFLAMLSPFLTGPFWAVVVLAAIWLMRRGAYGALVAAGIGAMLGLIAGMLTIAPVEFAVAGAALASLHRFVLALMRPLAF